MHKKLIIVISVCLLITIGLFCYLRFSNADKKFNVVFFDIGQGDAALINFKNGAKMLIDCGPDRKILNKLGKYLPFYDRVIDYLVITHFDNDHYGGCVDVLRRYQVKNIIKNSESKIDDPYWRIWREYESDEKAEIIVINEPKIFNINGTDIEFIAPDLALILESAGNGSNNRSLVFRLLNDDAAVMFTGDMEEPLEGALIEKYCSDDRASCPALAADILKIGHHGSDSSSGENFLKAVVPRTAVISVGPNRFGHPSLRVLKKLQRSGAEIFRTDEQGDISLDLVRKISPVNPHTHTDVALNVFRRDEKKIVTHLYPHEWGFLGVGVK